jgi:hypothetical protein
MQGAGRCRQRANGQSLLVLCPHEIAQTIKVSADAGCAALVDVQHAKDDD